MDSRTHDDNAGQPDPRVAFAAQRTLLAWVRTGLAMMGFGFVVSRFGLFLRELAVARDIPMPHRVGLSQWVGVAIIVLGVLVNTAAAVQHIQLVLRLNRGQLPKIRPVSLAVVLAAVLTIVGIVLAGYLLWLS